MKDSESAAASVPKCCLIISRNADRREIEKVAGEPPTWRQSILLSNGWEVVINFRDVKVEEMQALLPALGNGAGLPPVIGVPHPV